MDIKRATTNCNNKTKNNFLKLFNSFLIVTTVLRQGILNRLKVKKDKAFKELKKDNELSKKNLPCDIMDKDVITCSLAIIPCNIAIEAIQLLMPKNG